MIPNTGPFDVTGHPATSVPCGVSDGLPIGMMLVGRMGNARRSFALPTPTDGTIRAWLRREGVRIPLNVLGLPDAEVRLKLRRQPSSTTSAWPAGVPFAFRVWRAYGYIGYTLKANGTLERATKGGTLGNIRRCLTLRSFSGAQAKSGMTTPMPGRMIWCGCKVLMGVTVP